MLNLYIIVKSYVCNVIYIPSSFLIVINNEKKSFISHNLEIGYVKQLGYLGFEKWFIHLLKNDWEYLDKSTKYVIVIGYAYHIFDRKLIQYIKPIYPWNIGIEKKIIEDSENLEYRNNLIKKLEKKISENQEIIHKKDKELDDLKAKIKEIEELNNKKN